jgi:hypothetical protein
MPDPDADRIESILLELLGCRQGSICPSEVARHLTGGDAGWRALMQPVRDTAARLAQQGVVEVTQRGVPQPPAGPWRGAIRIRFLGGR